MSSVGFYTKDLLSKHGFDDGDMYCHDDLIEIVIKYVLPKIDQYVEVYTLQTSHNPIRARKVGHISVEHYPSTVELTPEYVDVSLEEINSVLGGNHEPQ